MILEQLGASRAGTRRLLIVADSLAQGTRLAELDWKSRGFEVRVLFGGGEEEANSASVQSIWFLDEPAGGVRWPDMGELVNAVAQAEVCIFLGDQPWIRVAKVICEAYGLDSFVYEPRTPALGDRTPFGIESHETLLLSSKEELLRAFDHPLYGVAIYPVGNLGEATNAAFDAAPPEIVKAARRVLEIVETRGSRSAEDGLPELSVIVPAYNEAANVELICSRLSASLEGLSAEILLIDDQSTDGTYEAGLEKAWDDHRIRVYQKSLPRGMGNGVRFGLEKARGRYVCVTMGDGSDEVERIPDLFRAVSNDGHALAIGCRYRKPENYASIPRLYRFWGACFRLATRVLLGFSLADYTNAFRLFDREALAGTGLESGGFEISPEITFKAWHSTRKIKEVDVRHLKRSAGQSSFSFMRAGPGYGKVLLKALLQRITGRWFVLDW